MKAMFAARQAVFFPVIGVMRAVLLNCGTSTLAPVERPPPETLKDVMDASVLLPTTYEELRVVFDFLMCSSTDLPHESASTAVEPIKIQIVWMNI